MLRTVGAVAFDTGRSESLMGVFYEAYQESSVGELSVANPNPTLLCRSSDALAHELVRDSKLTRVSDNAVFFVREIKPDGTGMTMIELVE